MQFVLTKEFIQELREAVQKQDELKVVELTHELHPADLAEIIEELDPAELSQFFQYLDSEKAADSLMELEDEVREKFLSTLTSEEIAKYFIDNLDSDDAADVISELPEGVKDEVISQLEDVEQASDIVDLLGYAEDTAGGLMAKEMIRVNENWTLTKCVREMRKQAENIENIYTIYVVDDDNKLRGTLSLKKLLFAPPRSKISSLYQKEVIFVKASASSEDVATIMDKYDLVVLPVLDELNRLIGRITIDDVVDVMREEAEKDYQLASGISKPIDFSDRMALLTRARLPWLLIGLVGGILGARVIEMHEGTLQINPEMAFFIPLIAAMGGNVGVQSSAIIVQSIANSSLRLDTVAGRLGKELLGSILNGLVCSMLILGYNLLFSDSLILSFTVAIALLSVIVVSAMLGTAVPLILNRYKIDPALATGPFITTMNDIFGLFIYFGIGRLIHMMF
ncbi:MAG TPA: magnesium transporter [Flavobacteriales bacterium]|nr:magnesium transporter [Flavobacteriales bacterium]